MRSVKNIKSLPLSLALILPLTLFTIPAFADITDSSASFSEKVGDIDMSKTDSTGSYIHPALGGGSVPQEMQSGIPLMSPPTSPGKELKREGSGGKKRHGMKGLHGYSRKSEGSKSKHGYSKGGHGYKYPGKSEGSKSKHGSYGDGYGRHGKAEGSKGRHGYSTGRHGYSKGGHGSYGHKSPFSHVLRFAKKLGLTDPQIADIRKKKIEFMKAKIRSEADHQIAHMEMEALVHSQTVDASKIRALGNDIIAAKTRMIRATIEAKIAILNILTPEQRKKTSKMHGMHN